MRGAALVGVLRDAPETYAPRCRRSHVAVMMFLTESGDLCVKNNPRYVQDDVGRKIADTWVRLQVTRGRRFGVLTVADLERSRSPSVVD